MFEQWRTLSALRSQVRQVSVHRVHDGSWSPYPWIEGTGGAGDGASLCAAAGPAISSSVIASGNGARMESRA